MATYQDQMQQVQRRRKIAEALMLQAAQPQAQQGGRFAVGPTATSTAASLASILGGGLLNRRAEQDEKAARDSEQQRIAQAMERMTGGESADPRQQAAREMLGGLPIETQQQVMGQQALKTLFPPNEQTKQPASVQEYEYARQNGFEGSFQDWIVAGGQSSRPSAVQEWEHYSNLPPEMQQRYLEMKRTPNMMVRDVNQVPTLIHPSVGAGTAIRPLSTQESEGAAANERKRQEAQGAALGKAQGDIAGGIQTKGANATSMTGLLDEADALVDRATGSLGGRVIDAAQAAYGGSNEGAEAIARLKVIQAGLMTNMPRMEGPQSDRDVQLYREAAGQIGDPAVPAPIKKAALSTIREIQEKYQQRALDAGAPAATGVPSPSGGEPPRISTDADYDALPSGTEFIAPDGSRRRKP